nr:pyruvate-flavodoxin oxidoreductase [Salmonella sp. NCTC 7297]
MTTSLTSRCHYQKIPCPAALNWKRYFTVWEATAAYPPRKIILKLSVILRHGMRKVISFMTLKKLAGLRYRTCASAKKPIRSAYLIAQADFVGCHQLQFIDKYQMAERLKPGGIFLLNTPYSADEVWSRLPQEVQAVLNQKKARFYVG